MMKWAILALTVICFFQMILGEFLVLKYAVAGAYGPMALQFLGFLVSLAGAAYGTWWLLDYWRDWHVK